MYKKRRHVQFKMQDLIQNLGVTKSVPRAVCTRKLQLQRSFYVVRFFFSVALKRTATIERTERLLSIQWHEDNEGQ